MNVNKLTVTDADYPEVLREIFDPPQVIYWAGQPLDSWLNQPKVAIVGSRKFSPYGKHVTERLVTDLARAGVVIISGLAYGIDITAHKTALATGGTAVAVLPSSLDQIYPAAHFSIASQITKQGSLITEYPPGSGIAYKSNFIARNRIISGLADAVLIPEAALKSGSLHTARFALEQGKTVMAVPGNITSPGSEGCNNLIKSGALPATSVEDIFFALKIQPSKAEARIKFTGTEIETAIYKLIMDGVKDQEDLITATAIDSPTLSSTLTMLEISGHIRPTGGGSWVIA
ncbi:DNA-processing protein DprA [Candidatus Saccharibacteria bacterium]|nr:DNA-processing protein DprA [Candidatus Saccharibacteria bacterium]